MKIRNLFVAFLFLGASHGIAFAQVAPKTANTKSKLSETKKQVLISNAFGAIWIDSDAEDADIEYDVRAVLRAGITPNSRDEYGETLLLRAIENNRVSIVEMLLRAGADVNMPSKETGDTPLIFASRSIDPFEIGARPMPHLVRLLLKHKPELNRRNKAGETALIAAVTRGNGEIVELLLKAGADYRLRDKNGMTALKWASQQVHEERVMTSSMPMIRSTKLKKFVPTKNS